MVIYFRKEISRTADSRVAARIHLLYSFFPSFKEDSCGSFLACRVPSPPPTTIIGARSIGRRDHSTAREHIHVYLHTAIPIYNCVYACVYKRLAFSYDGLGSMSRARWPVRCVSVLLATKRETYARALFCRLVK